MRIFIIFLVLISPVFAVNEITKVDMYIPCGTKAPHKSNITVHYIGCADQLTNELNKKLNNLDDSKEVSKLAKEFVEKNKNAYVSAFKSQAYAADIKKYPAIVFNDKYIVYGITDYDQARREYFRYRG